MTTGQATPCRSECAGGNACSCNATPHTHHICKHDDCQCHQPVKYGLDLVRDKDGREFYVPQGARLRVGKRVTA